MDVLTFDTGNRWLSDVTTPAAQNESSQDDLTETLVWDGNNLLSDTLVDITTGTQVTKTSNDYSCGADKRVVRSSAPGRSRDRVTRRVPVPRAG